MFVQTLLNETGKWVPKLKDESCASHSSLSRQALPTMMHLKLGRTPFVSALVIPSTFPIHPRSRLD